MSGFDDWVGQQIPDQVMEDAASWMALLDSSDCSSADRIAFARWLGEDPLHQGAFEELSEVWARLHMLSDVPAMIDHPNVIPFPVPTEHRPFNKEPHSAKGGWSTMVASLLVVVGVIAHLIIATPSDRHVTATGEVQVVALPDGSSVELNARSEIEVRIDARRREIELTDGEAIFHVQKDARPFVVRTELATVSAVGTNFSVRSDASLVEVSVIEGLVSVAATNSGTALTEYDSELLMRFTDEIALLGAGQRLELTRESKRFETVSERSLQDDLSWRHGEVVFSDTPLITVLAEMRRYQELSIFIGDPVLNSLRVSGRFRVGDAESFLTFLSEQYDIAVGREEASYVVLRSH